MSFWERQPQCEYNRTLQTPSGQYVRTEDKNLCPTHQAMANAQKGRMTQGDLRILTSSLGPDFKVKALLPGRRG